MHNGEMTVPYGEFNGYPTEPSGGAAGSGIGPAPSPGYPQTAQPSPGYPHPGQPAAGAWGQAAAPNWAQYPQQSGYGPTPAGYWGPDAYAPYGRDPLTGEPYSDKSKVAAGLLQIVPAFLGLPLGLGRFYVGSTGTAVAQLLLFLLSVPLILLLVGIPMLAVVWLWVVIDGVRMLAGQTRDANGSLLRP